MTSLGREEDFRAFLVSAIGLRVLHLIPEKFPSILGPKDVWQYATLDEVHNEHQIQRIVCHFEGISLSIRPEGFVNRLH